MCLIALAWRAHPRYRLVLAGNRDEEHARPTLPLAAWDDAPEVVGGRDGLHGGGWLALRGGRLVTVTNVRRPPAREGLSRGALVADLVRADAPVAQAFAALADTAPCYRPFNLLACDATVLAFASNLDGVPAPGEDGRGFVMRLLDPGVHGVSNGALDAPWPKTATLMTRLDAWLGSMQAHAPSAGMPPARDLPSLDPLFEALADDRPAPEAALPDTGVGPALERFLSPAFIRGDRYGTRASTVVLVADDHAWIVERRFGPGGVPEGETRLRTHLPGALPETGVSGNRTATN